MSSVPSPERSDALPRHIAIIMDGNGRWAKTRLLPRVAGHRAGVETVRRIVESCAKRGVVALTLFAFSSENWRRPANEVGLLLDLFVAALERESRSLHKNNVRLRIVGDTQAFPEKLRAMIRESEHLTKNNSGLQLNIAANYGGRWDIVQAARQLVERACEGKLKAEEVTEELLASLLTLSNLPEPDLFIRTGGEQRISNFLLWHLAYTELFFTDVPWPEFDEKALDAALNSFSGRERRFGRTSEQIRQIGA